MNNFPSNIDPFVNHAVLLEMVTKAVSFRCEWCGGFGHKTDKCPTPWAIKKEAQLRGVTFEWGALKGLCWDPNSAAAISERQIASMEAVSRLLAGKNRKRPRF